MLDGIQLERSQEMILKILLVAAVLGPTLICEGQDQKPAAPAAPAATTPAGNQTPAPVDAATSSTTAAPLATGHLAASYVIGPNDQIAVEVWKEGAVSGSFLVRPDGVITMPLLGEVMAAGFSPLDLAAQITIKLRKFLQDPVVSVVVVGIHSKNIYMIGESSRKGAVELTPGMTILQAIGAAGLTDNANTKKIYILRDEDGVRHKIPVHYKEALKGNLQFDIPLKPGDTIVVP
jgi:polysaccharide export outer membrane protein